MIHILNGAVDEGIDGAGSRKVGREGPWPSVVEAEGVLPTGVVERGRDASRL